MGYTTDFVGQFTLNKVLDEETYDLLDGLNQTRRMKRKVDPKYGVDGEFYIDGSDDYGMCQDDNIVDYSTPPATQPGLWCQWAPSHDGLAIEWDGVEKFYRYVEWLHYLITAILAPRGYVLKGTVDWQGEESDDFGAITVKDNVITIAEGYKTYKKAKVYKKDY